MLLPWLGLRAAAHLLLSAIEAIEEPRMPIIIAAGSVVPALPTN